MNWIGLLKNINENTAIGECLMKNLIGFSGFQMIELIILPFVTL